MFVCRREKIKKIALFIMILMLFVIKVDASSCSTSEKKSLKSEASKIEIVKYFDDTYIPQGEYYYNVNLVNFTEKFYIADSLGNRFEYSSKIDSDSIFGMYWPGQTITFKIYATKGTLCSDELIRTVKIKFDYYNDYSQHEACKGIEEFKLCKRNYNKRIESEEWFLEKVNEYKKNLNNKQDIKEKENKTIAQMIKEFINNNPLTITIIAFVAILIIVLLIIKKIKNTKKIKVKYKVKDKVGDKYD